MFTKNDSIRQLAIPKLYDAVIYIYENGYAGFVGIPMILLKIKSVPDCFYTNGRQPVRIKSEICDVPESKFFSTAIYNRVVMILFHYNKNIKIPDNGTELKIYFSKYRNNITEIKIW